MRVRDLGASVRQRLLDDKKRHLLRLQEQRAQFIDPRSVPPDLEEAIERVRAEIVEIEMQLAQSHTR